MTPACTACGGPLFRKECLGVCATPQSRSRPYPRSLPTSSPNVVRMVLPEVYALVWEAVYTTDQGQPLNVARWMSFVVTPKGHRIRVWPRQIRRAA